MQPKLKVSEPGDRYEREAERIASRVAVGQDTAVADREVPEPHQPEPATVQRAPIRDQAPTLGADELVEENLDADDVLQADRVLAAAVPRTVAPDVQARILTPTAGRPIPTTLRLRMERVLGADFGGVRLHDAPQDQADASSLGARAFTYGTDIWFGPGATLTDRRLLAHELVHVVQQRPGLRRPAAEPATTSTETAPPMVQRGWFDWFDWALQKVLGMLPGYDAIRVMIGGDAATGDGTPSTAGALVEAVLSFLPGGAALVSYIKESQTLAKAGAWLRGEIASLNITWSTISDLLGRAYNALEVGSLSRNLENVERVFTPTFNRIKRFVLRISSKLYELALQGLLSSVGPMAADVLDFLKSAGSVLKDIASDPFGFFWRFAKMMKRAVTGFVAEIGTYVKSGLMTWLIGALGVAGVTMPTRFDLSGMMQLAMQVLGLTYARFRAILVKLLDEPRVAAIEQRFEFLRQFATNGVGTAVNKMQELGKGLGSKLHAALKSWVLDKLIDGGSKHLLTLFNPAVAGVKTFYAGIMVFVDQFDRLKSIGARLTAALKAVAPKSSGASVISSAANMVTSAMGNALPVALDFIARSLGLGDIGNALRQTLERFSKPVGAAFERTGRWVVARTKRIWRRVRTKAQQIVEWWNTKRRFDVGGKPHTLYFNGQRQLMLASTPITFAKFIDRTHSEAEKGNYIVHFPLKNQSTDAKNPVFADKKGKRKYDSVVVGKFNDRLSGKKGKQADELKSDVITICEETKASKAYQMIGASHSHNLVNLTHHKNDNQQKVIPRLSENQRSNKKPYKQINQISFFLNYLSKKVQDIDYRCRRAHLLNRNQRMLPFSNFYFGKTTQMGFGRYMRARPLTMRAPEGGTPNDERSKTFAWSIFTLRNKVRYKKIPERKDGSAKRATTETVIWSRGHLLNHRLGGPGIWPNLAPIGGKSADALDREDTNREHENVCEKKLKSFVFDTKEPGIADYIVKVKYDDHADQEILKEAQRYLTADLKEVKYITRTVADLVISAFESRFAPKYIDFEAYRLEQTDDGKYRRAEFIVKPTRIETKKDRIRKLPYGTFAVRNSKENKNEKNTSGNYSDIQDTLLKAATLLGLKIPRKERNR